jgi:hypothetical protein
MEVYNSLTKVDEFLPLSKRERYMFTFRGDLLVSVLPCSLLHLQRIFGPFELERLTLLDPFYAHMSTLYPLCPDKVHRNIYSLAPI